MAKEYHNDEPQGPHYTTSWKQRWLQAIVLAATSFAAIYFSFKSWSRINSANYDATYDIANNWKRGAIMDIAVNDICPVGYEEALGRVWEGNAAGCWCRDVSPSNRATYKINDNVYSGRCSTNQIKAGCQDVQSNPPVNLSSWSIVDGKRQKICVARSNETWADLAPHNNGTCYGAGVTQCGSSPENVFCTRESKCPISFIKVETLRPPLNEANIAACKYDDNCVVLHRHGTEAKLLRFVRGEAYDALPLSELAMNEYSMCNTLKKHNLTPNRTDFWLAHETRNTCNDTGAGLWNVTDSLTESELFEVNGLNPIVNYLSDYGFYDGTTSGNDYDWHLYSRNYIPWSTKCRNRMGTFISRSHGVKSLKFAQLLQLIVAGIAGAILGIVLPIFIIFGLKPDFVKRFNYIGKVVQLPFMIICIILAGIIAKFFHSFVENQCSSQSVLDIIAGAGAEAKAAYNDNIKALAAVLFALLFDIGAYFYHKYRGNDQRYYPQVNIEQQHIPKTQQQGQPTYAQQQVTTTTYVANTGQRQQAGTGPGVNVRVNV